MLSVETKEIKNEILIFDCILKACLFKAKSYFILYYYLFEKSKVDLYNYIYSVFIFPQLDST